MASLAIFPSFTIAKLCYPESVTKIWNLEIAGAVISKNMNNYS